ncbi:uncharacterized protein JCM6883_004661 [Sporobolomyces salmoneus]|uniref:uncharacterized protein n=1 Tax=Sporobolomyces salmoneus TaxID=183962 RepID=UPI00316DCE3C
MSAIIPPKRPPRSPLKLQLPGSSPAPSNLSTPSADLSIAPTSSRGPSSSSKPSLKLGGVTQKLSALSLNVPSRYASALNGPSESDSELDDEQDGSNRPWAVGEQERMAGELLDVINGPSAIGLEDELSGRTRRARSASRVSSSRPSSSQGLGHAQSREQFGTTTTTGGGAVGGMLSPPLLNVPSTNSIPTSSSSSTLSPYGGGGSAIHDGETDDENDDFDMSPGALQDLGRLGEGASGEVRKVLHKPTGLVMAKKTITTSPNPKLHKQHLRELSFMRDCTDPHIVQYYGAFLESNNTQIGICMEFCEAGSLDSLYKKVKSKGWRTGEKVLGKIADSILSGLVYLHDHKIIHRDIKPSNVLVTRDGQIKLCDFGVSGELVNSLAGTFVGTTFYLSPERIRGGQYSINSDVWSTALTVLEVALNRFPFPAPHEAPLSGPIELLTYLVRMETVVIPDEPEVGIKYTNAFRNFIQICLDKNPATRPAPHTLLSHGWIRRSRERQPPADLGSWVRGLEN